MSSTTRVRGLAATTVAMGLVVGFGGIASAEPTPTATPSATPTTSQTPSATPTAAETTPAAAETPAPSATPTAAEPTPAAAETPAATPTPALESAAASPMLVSVPTTDPRCTVTKPLTLFNINDFHGRIFAATKLFTPVEQLRATQPDVVLASAGDNVGATIFESFIANDDPAIDVLNAANLQVSAPGNHEFDKGLADFQGHIETRANFDYVAANMTGTDMAAYKIITTASGIRVAYIGAEVGELPTYVDWSQMGGVTVSPEVAAVNATADAIRAAGAADVIVAEVHNEIISGYNANVDVVFNGHTHASYTQFLTDGTPIVQAGQYGEKLGRVDLAIGTGNVICGPATAQVIDATAVTPDLTLPRIAQIDAIAAAAKAAAAGPGSEAIGQACMNITRGGTFDATGKLAENRLAESTASDMVADAFFDIGGGDPNTVIGMQNPGGTRADILSGEVTYAEAAAVLPFANTIMSTQITGAQLKTVLEQQWQRDKTGAVPSRPYLQLGLSDNVSYTYDETLPEGSRITGIFINGAPVDTAKLYTIVSGSFLIAGGDNFHELAKGVNTTDTGKSDLEAFVNWVKETKAGQLCPEIDRQAVSLSALPSTVSCSGVQFTVGTPGAIAKDTLNFTNTVPAETTLDVVVGDTKVATVPVVDGVATVSYTPAMPSAGGPLTLVTGNGTIVNTNATVEACALLDVDIVGPDGTLDSVFTVGDDNLVTATGTLVDANGPLANATLVFTPLGGEPVTVVTDAEGHFTYTYQATPEQLADPAFQIAIAFAGDATHVAASWTWATPGYEKPGTTDEDGTVTEEPATTNPPKLANTGAGEGLAGLVAFGAVALAGGTLLTRKR